MNRLSLNLVLLAGVIAFSGCKKMEFYMLQPSGYSQPIPREGITVPYDPLQYKFAKRSQRVAVRITNPTDTPIRLQGNRSYIVDPWGESHPIRERNIGPHSYVDASLPPQMPYVGTYPYPAYAGPTWGWGYGPHGGWDMGFYYPPSYAIVTPFDWEWRSGQIRLRLGYERENKEFNHDFVFERRKAQ